VADLQDANHKDRSVSIRVKEFILDNQKYFEDYITRSAYHSNRIEGNTLSYAETYAILFNDNSFSVNAKPREIYEAINHKYALSYVLEHSENQLDQQMIKDIGIMINKNISDINIISSSFLSLFVNALSANI
jgi:Fic family protein